MFAIRRIGKLAEQQAMVRVNFGESPFHFQNINFTSPNTLILPVKLKGIENIQILETNIYSKTSKEEEERLNNVSFDN
jgi:hypothetical protein